MFTQYVRTHSSEEIYYCFGILNCDNLILCDIDETFHLNDVMLQVILYCSDVNAPGVSKMGVHVCQCD